LSSTGMLPPGLDSVNRQARLAITFSPACPVTFGRVTFSRPRPLAKVPFCRIPRPGKPMKALQEGRPWPRSTTARCARGW
jgi:hypothetical protein